MSITRATRLAARRIRSGAFAEAIVMVGTILVLNVRFFPDAPAFHGWMFNPYLVPVLLIACRYGVVSGMFTGALAAGASIVNLIVVVQDPQSLGFLTTPHYTPVLGLMVTALVSGALSDRIRSHLVSALAAHDEINVRLERLSTEFALLSDEKHLLDKQVLSEEQTFESLVTLFSDLDRLKSRQFPSRILAIAERILGGGRTALYRIGGPWDEGTAPAAAGSTGPGAAVLLTGRGEWPRGLPTAHPVVSAAIESAGAITLAQVQGWADPAVFKREPIHLACPIDARWGGSRLLLVTRDLPFSAFAPGRVRALGLALGLAARALRRAQVMRRLRTGTDDARLARVTSRTYFNTRLDEELTAARRNGAEVTLVKMQVAGLAGEGRGRSRLRRETGRLVQRVVESGGLVAHVGRQGSITILVPSASPVEPEGLTRELEAGLAQVYQLVGRAMAPGEVRITTLRLDPGEASEAARPSADVKQEALR